MAEEGSLDKRLKAAEGYIAESRDDNAPIRLSEITERIQEVIHRLEIMDVKLQAIESRTRSANRLRLAIGAAVAVILLEKLL